MIAAIYAATGDCVRITHLEFVTHADNLSCEKCFNSARVCPHWPTCNNRQLQRTFRNARARLFGNLIVLALDDSTRASTSKRSAEESNDEEPTLKKRRYAESEKTFEERRATQPSYDREFRLATSIDNV